MACDCALGGGEDSVDGGAWHTSSQDARLFSLFAGLHGPLGRMGACTVEGQSEGSHQARDTRDGVAKFSR